MPGPVPIRRIAVIGAGPAGRRFALRCVRAGFAVSLEDVMPVNLRRAQADFEDLSGQITSGKMEFAHHVEDAVREAELVIDFVPDELESKLEIFCLLDRMAPPKTILCTPSEALSITDLASCTYRSDRCFAVRGDLGSGSEVRILHPEATLASAITGIRQLFTALEFEVTAEIDPEAPMLVKNSRI